MFDLKERLRPLFFLVEYRSKPIIIGLLGIVIFLSQFEFIIAAQTVQRLTGNNNHE
jgi:hypothetical protein